MKDGLNQALLAKVYRKIEALEYDYSQELLPERLQKTDPDINHYVDLQILYSYGEETYVQLFVFPVFFGVLTLGEAYLFFYDKVSGYAPVVTGFVRSEGGYDWVESMANSDKLTPEQHQACKALVVREREFKNKCEKTGYPF